ncbi:hypothetical protein [Bradyrhizobium neotropicale]|uniref:hypothetical protein n=1 Tax=Bradyrhizobium neotropicale TaxID=1497615 RepID=UPI001AD7309D|nr:hypothetical protein [Bradyrhizobium neotropicale]MBO4228520.1 hypothetical protein [Bradyrhizobium neotropicale]
MKHFLQTSAAKGGRFGRFLIEHGTAYNERLTAMLYRPPIVPLKHFLQTCAAKGRRFEHFLLVHGSTHNRRLTAMLNRPPTLPLKHFLQTSAAKGGQFGRFLIEHGSTHNRRLTMLNRPPAVPLRQFLQTCAANGGQFERFLLEHGTAYKGRELPKKYSAARGALGWCFRNAAGLALIDDNLTYVEGYAVNHESGGSPIHHAWCVDRRGRVIETTWQNVTKAEYFGMPIEGELLAVELSRVNHWGVLFTDGKLNDELVKRLTG